MAAHVWTLSAGVALVADASWLRNPGIRYLFASVAATGVAILIALGLPRRSRGWAYAAVGAALVFCVLAIGTQRQLGRIDGDWTAYRMSVVRRGSVELARELESVMRSIRSTATDALDAPANEMDAFSALREDAHRMPGLGVVLYRRGKPAAWAGTNVVATDTLVAPVGVVRSPFYVTLYAAATRGETRAVASAVIHAASPGDSLVSALADRVASRVGLDGFVVDADPRARPIADTSDAKAAAATLVFAPGRDTLLAARPVAPEREEARLVALERARTYGTLTLALALICFVAAVWREERTHGWRLVPLGVWLVAVALAPLSALSSDSTLFDPTVYYAPLGGALTATVGALGIAAAAVLLGLLLLKRRRGRTIAIPGRARLLVLLGVAVLGPFLLRALADGVAPPPGGVSDAIWLAWEVSLFLVTATLLIAIAGSAGTLAVRGRRVGLHPIVAPLVAVVAALLAPAALESPGVWPAWYLALWVVAVACLVASRPHRRLVLAAGAVAALGATTLTWNAGVRGRIALANRDVSSLDVVQSDVTAALRRFGDALADAPEPATQADLVRAYMQSDLLGSGYPSAMQSWTSDDSLRSSVRLDPVMPPDSGVRAAVDEARVTCTTVLRTVLGMPGLYAVLAVPHPSNAVTAVIVAPRTRLIPEDPFHALLGIEERERGQAPYTVALVDADPALALAPGQTRWYRSGDQLHGDHLVRTGSGEMRAHIEIDLRSQAILVQGGTLIVFVDLILLSVLWTASVFPERVLWRVLRGHARRWRRSYRARLTVGLFAFFVLPAVAFALWSYQRLQLEDQQARELLVRATLHSYAGGADPQSLAMAGGRLDTPLLTYTGGQLSDASESMLDALAPTGRFMPSEVYADLRDGREVYVARTMRVGSSLALFGYLTVESGPGAPLVLAAPARGSELVLDQRRRDLGVLVMFATVLGAIAALLLSRAASRSLAKPIGQLRAAALAIAAEETEPPLSSAPPEEFEPVFSAFRRMAADLGASRAALESAQRRTSQVLRNVASGVVAFAPPGTVLLANPRAEALLGRALPAGATLDQAAPEMARRLRAFLARSLEEEEFDLSVGARQLQARLTRLTGGGGVVLTLDDVTDLARAQRVLAWGEMARQVAHEIKNPLTPIRLGVQHLKRAYADARSDFDHILDQNASRILSEIDRLDEIARAFSRYGTAPAERQPAEPVDVAAVARDVMELERLGGGSGAGVEWRLDGADDPLVANARTDELREVLLNVLENARLAAATRIALSLDRHDGRVVIQVADNGQGIPAAVLPRIFEPHFSTRTSGSGLGLAISRQLVESWGGEIEIASESGRGTTVRVELRENGAEDTLDRARRA
ncbi:MAG TPA: ATP-binding protein [Gemmatimonadaceae bacterium]|nr:ATP-binding protein [Gemmatimonadaceae bacterium]